jgi:DNA-binding transcriptional regulator YdaS (Cro superfamily)
MNSYVFDIGDRGRKVSRFIGQVRAEIQHALNVEKSLRKITQQMIANLIGVNRSVINRQIMGEENLTLRRVAEIAWALGWEIVFELRKPQIIGAIISTGIPVSAGSTENDDAALVADVTQTSSEPEKIAA